MYSRRHMCGMSSAFRRRFSCHGSCGLGQHTFVQSYGVAVATCGSANTVGGERPHSVRRDFFLSQQVSHAREPSDQGDRRERTRVQCRGRHVRQRPKS